MRTILLALSLVLFCACATGPGPDPHPQPGPASADMAGTKPDLAPFCAANVDYQTDALNCGACGEACPTSTSMLTVSCSAGRCVGACVAPWMECGPGPIIHCATDTTKDGNCGGCGHVCTTGTLCHAGTCS